MDNYDNVQALRSTISRMTPEERHALLLSFAPSTTPEERRRAHSVFSHPTSTERPEQGPPLLEDVRPREARAAHKGCVYIARFADTDYYKIGMTRTSVPERLSDLPGLNTDNAQWRFVDDARGCERMLHRYFRKDRSHGEFFRLSPEQVREAVELLERVVITPYEDRHAS